MYYSYVMGIDNSIKELNKEGFSIESEGDNFKVSFPEDKAKVWEDFIVKHLGIGFWNEYLAGDKVIFLFNLKKGIKRFEVKNFEDEEVLKLCEKLCNCKFESIKSMLLGNGFYKDKINI